MGKFLLNNDLAPLTFAWGFVSASLSEVSSEFRKWNWLTLRATQSRAASGSLRELLRQLEPLDAEGRTTMFVSTKSEWVAYFDNSARGANPEIAIEHLSRTLRVKGFVAVDVPNTLDGSIKGCKQGVWGCTAFKFYDGTRCRERALSRAVSISNDVSGWRFDAQGAVQGFEALEMYKRRLIRERFSAFLLEEYAKTLGIDLFNEIFYGPEACVISSDLIFRSREGTISLVEAQKLLGLGDKAAIE